VDCSSQRYVVRSVLALAELPFTLVSVQFIKNIMSSAPLRSGLRARLNTGSVVSGKREAHGAAQRGGEQESTDESIMPGARVKRSSKRLVQSNIGEHEMNAIDVEQADVAAAKRQRGATGIVKAATQPSPYEEIKDQLRIVDDDDDDVSSYDAGLGALVEDVIAVTKFSKNSLEITQELAEMLTGVAEQLATVTWHVVPKIIRDRIIKFVNEFLQECNVKLFKLTLGMERLALVNAATIEACIRLCQSNVIGGCARHPFITL
jgi:hypothetical protein